MELQDIIDSVKIEEYIKQYIDLHEQNGELFGLSPFTEEKTPSFSVTPNTNLFFDFSSNYGGNIINFIEKYHKCGFKDALRILKEYANIKDDYVDARLATTKIIKKYKQTKPQKEDIFRKILPADVMNQYEYDISKFQGWIDEGIKPEVLKQYQVMYDPFSNRIVFPIRDLNGNIISIKGRTLDPDYKEKKLAKYIYFHRIDNVDFLFGYYRHISEIQNKKEIILFEGEKSVMISEAWGIKNTCAIMTSHLNPAQIPILIKLGVRVVFALDKEIDLRKDDNIKKLCRFVKVEYINDVDNLIEDKMSPVDKGREVWNRLYERRLSLN